MTAARLSLPGAGETPPPRRACGSAGPDTRGGSASLSSTTALKQTSKNDGRYATGSHTMRMCLQMRLKACLWNARTDECVLMVRISASFEKVVTTTSLGQSATVPRPVTPGGDAVTRAGG